MTTFLNVPTDITPRSKFVPFICFSDEAHKHLADEYILKEIKEFFEKIEPELTLEKDITRIEYPDLITNLDFEDVSIDYFYDKLFFILGERSDNDRLQRKILWSVAFDEGCTPIQTYLTNRKPGFAKQSKSNDSSRKQLRKFGTIDINSTPIFYYIHFSLQEIINFIKKTRRDAGEGSGCVRNNTVKP